MPRRRTRTAHPFTPFLLWTDVTMRTTEMMLASMQVIGHRTQRLAAAGAAPNARDRREFTRMGQEKIEAAAASMGAMAAHMMTMNQRLGADMVKAGLQGAQAITSLASSRTSAHALGQQAKLMQSATQSAAKAMQVGSSTARLASRGLKPIHSRATANAKRLGKR